MRPGQPEALTNRTIARAALYARVSTLNNQDPEMQLFELREYAGCEFTNQGVSGYKGLGKCLLETLRGSERSTGGGIDSGVDDRESYVDAAIMWATIGIW
jgi:hypothetical protein